MLECYESRDAILRGLGYTSYADYLNSDRWSRIRRSVFARASRICEVCGYTATEVHHLSYSLSVLRGDKKKLCGLIAICRECHERAEFDDTGRKMSLGEANSRIGRSAQKAKKQRHKPSNKRRKKKQKRWIVEDIPKTTPNPIVTFELIDQLPKDRRGKLTVRSLEYLGVSSTSAYDWREKIVGHDRHPIGRCIVRTQLATEQEQIVTRKLLKKIQSGKGNLTKETAAYLGVQWPLTRGWRKRIIGKPRRSIVNAENMTE